MTKNDKPFDFGNANVAKIADEAQELELLHFATREPLGVFLKVRGFESDSFRAAARRETNAERKRNFEAERKAKGATVRLLEDDEASGLHLSLALLVGWRTVIKGESKAAIFINGEPREFNEENARWFLSEYTWVIPQINEFAGEIQNFIKA